MNSDTFVVEEEAPGKVLCRLVTLRFQGSVLHMEVRDVIADSLESYDAEMVREP